MKKLSKKSAKTVLVVHLFFLALWLGGVVSILALLFNTDIKDFNATLSTYSHMKTVAQNVIGWGGIGTLLTGLILAIFTHWGLFKHKWVITKFVLVIGLILFGMFFNEHRILENLQLLENQPESALNTTQLLDNHRTLKIGLIIGAIGYVIVISIATFKPWMGKKPVHNNV